MNKAALVHRAVQNQPAEDVDDLLAARDPTADHLPADRFWFERGSIYHAGCYMDRRVAGRLLPLLEKPDAGWRGVEPSAADLARQLRKAIRQYDTHHSTEEQAA